MTKQHRPENGSAEQKGNPSMEILQPPNWPRPNGFSNGIAARGRLIFIAGQTPSGDNYEPVGIGDYRLQYERIMEALTIQARRPAQPAHDSYVTSKREYLASYKSIGKVYRELIGRHYPAMTAVEVAALVEDEAKVEIEATAVIPTRTGFPNCHSGARAFAREPGIHSHDRWLWIPDSLALLGFRNDRTRFQARA
jgi:enamine deaminase RidA (YjgF/YER057c/UK114 family)